jgi:hypothetical protein
MPTLQIVEQSTPSAESRRFEIKLIADFGSASAIAEISQSLSMTDRDILRWYLEDFPRYPFPPAPEVASEVEPHLRMWGEDLFRQLFLSNDEARALWQKVNSILSRTRVELTTFNRHPEIIWELMWDPRAPRPVALEAQAFVRTPTLRMLRKASKPTDSFRILVVICRPAGKLDVPLRSVAGYLIRALSHSGESLQLKVLRPQHLRS